MYKYRMVVCGYCEHRFMWQETGCEYAMRTDENKGRIAKCPKCSKRLAVFDKKLKAESIKLSDDIKVMREFGI